MRVFVSSTFIDLVDYREAVTRAILAAGDIPEDMLYWPAEENRPLDVCMRRLKASDLFILILAHRYGCIPPGNDKSITEIEFDTAISSGKPVLAFCLDENHPWPPSFLERDEVTFSRLRKFHERVKEAIAIRHFTTPESLEAAVSQAVSHCRSESLERVGKGRFVSASRSINRRECLLYAPSALVMIGRAPDGAPLLLDVKREIDLSSTIDAIAKRIGKSRNDEYIRRMKKEVDFHARSFSLSRGIREATLNCEATSATVYSSDIPIGRLLGANLLQILTASQVNSARLTDSFGRSSARREGWVREGTWRSGIESRVGLDARVTSVGGANRFLCLPIDNEESWTGGWDSGEFVLWRSFMEESFHIFSDVTYLIGSQGGDGRQRLLAKTKDSIEHHSQWAEILSSIESSGEGPVFQEIKVPRHSYVEALVGVVRAVAKLHGANILHGDIKPSNILITAKGVELIDEIGLDVGEVAPTVTIGWSAPEQLCRQPLDSTADIFSLGLLLVRGLGCELLGREVRFRLPGDLEAVAMEDPTVYLDPRDDSLPISTRKGWLDALERCLGADPRKRWPTAVSFADALDELLSSERLEGTVSMRFPWSETPVLVTTTHGKVMSAWILPDTWN